MAKGILYIMSTVVDGLIKIGKTQTTQYENRMKNLESTGYHNVSGLKRQFAIEVEDYDEKERMLQKVLSRSRVSNSELFSTDLELAISLLSAFEGKQIYPKPTDQPKAEVFTAAAESISSADIPDGTYYMQRRINSIGKTVKATMQVTSGKFNVLAGSDFCPVTSEALSDILSSRRKSAKVKDGKITKDEEFNSASYAAMFVIGSHSNGLTRWKDKDGKTLKEILYSDDDD